MHKRTADYCICPSLYCCRSLEGKGCLCLIDTYKRHALGWCNRPGKKGRYSKEKLCLPVYQTIETLASKEMRIFPLWISPCGGGERERAPVRWVLVSLKEISQGSNNLTDHLTRWAWSPDSHGPYLVGDCISLVLYLSFTLTQDSKDRLRRVHQLTFPSSVVTLNESPFLIFMLIRLF